MAHNPEIQNRLLNDINQVMEGKDEKDLNEHFDTLLNQIPYLDAVIKVSCDVIFNNKTDSFFCI